ncbi:hypothetical protein PPL_09368 [Heterostelium album PN500]|uniref:Fatty acid hydroxylase domain-containing protein n=1 Tax=Heterostelium pallidum (strain ATCC 26659 / Pp 5 / PN500) TaxID=670386 RepID=D3BLD4_HETP5|nr:hypothetical protein PPL_09368 [Heterostelium album PN500]EFA77868.1 hypothetical protein PPL_09368 [Heterostelium album PN500]|eukprot:XP_020429996.1 hypothetical protein PPL_09368 [Heterostelium album PN500]
MSTSKTVLDIEFPNYISAALPYFIIFFVLEQLFALIIKKKDDFLLKDSFSSLSTGLTTIIYEKIVPITLLKSIEFIVVIYIWIHYRIVDIPEDSKLASVATFLLIDFGYYWFHRLAHEVNYMWATHVTHHSSEKYLGPLEWIINTPSHHRVHHGRNPKYIDKNYAGTLIIWDRLFGTFQEEEEEVFFGLVHSLGSSDPTWCQIHHWYDMYKRTKHYPKLTDKIKVYLCGPGWRPGIPRMGLITDIPMPHKGDIAERIGEGLTVLLNTYIISHFMLISIFSIVCLSVYEDELGPTRITCTMAYLYLSLTTFGAIFDKKRYAMTLELIRLVLFIAFTWDALNSTVQYIRLFYFVSSAWVIANHFSGLSFKSKLK